MARKRRQKAKNARRALCQTRFSTMIKQLAEAFAAGEACGFALHDALTEAGHPDLASHFHGNGSVLSCQPGEFCLALDNILPGRLKRGLLPVPDQSSGSRKKEREATLHDVCHDLEKWGVAQVEVEYDGYGDSGQVERITFLDSDGHEVAEEHWPRILYEVGNRPNVSLCDTIDWLACDLLPTGWENNNGAYGTLTVDVLTRTGRLDHHDRYVANSDSTQEFDFS